MQIGFQRNNNYVRPVVERFDLVFELYGLYCHIGQAADQLGPYLRRSDSDLVSVDISECAQECDPIPMHIIAEGCDTNWPVNMTAPRRGHLLRQSTPQQTLTSHRGKKLLCHFKIL